MKLSNPGGALQSGVKFGSRLAAIQPKRAFRLGYIVTVMRHGLPETRYVIEQDASRAPGNPLRHRAPRRRPVLVIGLDRTVPFVGMSVFSGEVEPPAYHRTSSTWSDANTLSASQLLDVTRILFSGNRSTVKVTSSEVAISR